MFASRFLLLQLVCTTIGLVAADFESPLPIPQLPPGYIHHSDIKTAYKLSTDELSWEGARESCRSENARLAVIDTQRKLDYVISMRSWMNYVWTGIYRNTWAFGNWKAVDDNVQLSSPLPWSITQIGFVGNCVAVSGAIHGLGSWPCLLRYAYVCEIPDPINTNIIVAK